MKGLDDVWESILKEDRAAFHRHVEPLLDEMIRAAERDIQYYQETGELRPSDVSAEELVGETLLRAWKGRRERPVAMSVKAWLLGLQHRILGKLIEVDHLERDLWSVSLEEVVPPDPLFDDEESFWEWYQPDDLQRWEDVLPSDAFADEVQAPDVEAASGEMEPDGRRALYLHEEHELTLAEVAQIIGRTVQDTASLVARARTDTGR